MDLTWSASEDAFRAEARGWLEQNLAEWKAEHGGDPGRLFVGGHSAGGHLAALAALSKGWTEQRGLPDTVIRGALPISGTYLFGPDSGLSMRPRFLGPADSGHDQAASR